MLVVEYYFCSGVGGSGSSVSPLLGVRGVLLCVLILPACFWGNSLSVLQVLPLVALVFLWMWGFGSCMELCGTKDNIILRECKKIMKIFLNL